MGHPSHIKGIVEWFSLSPKGGTDVSFSANVLKVMIASPGDVAEERKIVTEQIYRWNDANAAARQLVLLPVKWETHTTPQLGAHPQKIINRQLLDDTDIVIGIFGTRIGTPTEDYASGTVEEIKLHAAAGKTVKVYFSDVPRPPSAINYEQYASVQKFREEIQSDGIYATYVSLEQFRGDFSHHLDIELNSLRYRWLPPPELRSGQNDGRLSEDALRMLQAVVKEKDGELIFQEDFGICISDEVFTDGTHRSVARWKAALNDLLVSGAMEPSGESIFHVTAHGYEVADKANQSKANTQPAETPFVKTQQEHTLELLKSLHHSQRDLLRLLLLKGGSVDGGVVSNARSGIGSIDFNGLVPPLKRKGLLTQEHDNLLGTMTLTVNASIADSLKSLLFPRDALDKSDAPYFAGV